MSKPLTQAQRQALEHLRAGPLHRPRYSYEWIAGDGRRHPLVVISSLRKRGLVVITTSKERMTAHLTQAAKEAK